ncbi:MAG: hypothetical protein ACTHK2_18085 [Dokdonella sp.]|uniref:hypothetical protein n=1 Tax=Dokdonella sp. TaxID=2291710 RepID=UPI003F7E9538
MDTENFLYGFLGWLAGVLAPVITDGIKEGRRTVRVRQAIKSELHGHARRLAIAYKAVETNRGRFKRAEIEWVRGVILRHRGEDALVNALGKLLAGSDGELEALAVLSSTNNLPALRENKLPYLTSKLPTVESFQERELQALLAVVEQTEQFNSLARDAEYWGRQTFVGSDADRQRSSNNAVTSLENASRKAKDVVDEIEAYLALPEPKLA